MSVKDLVADAQDNWDRQVAQRAVLQTNKETRDELVR